MNIYFSGSTRVSEEYKDKYFKIIKILKEINLKVFDSWLVENLYNIDDTLTSQERLLKNIQLLHESDIAIFEISTPSLGVGYFIGQAIASHKKTLCLYKKGVNHDDLSEIVEGSNSSNLTLKKYTDESLETIIRDYIANFKLDDLRKFNFIATEEIIKYISEGAKREKKSKSEFLRDKILKEIMK